MPANSPSKPLCDRIKDRIGSCLQVPLRLVPYYLHRSQPGLMRHDHKCKTLPHMMLNEGGACIKTIQLPAKFADLA